jgi:hypothetical protein
VSTREEQPVNEVAELGLDPRGHHVTPGTKEYAEADEDEFALPDRWVPWDADAAELTGDQEDEGQTVLGYLSNLAEAEDMSLVDFLALKEPDDEDDPGFE